MTAKPEPDELELPNIYKAAIGDDNFTRHLYTDE